MKKYKIVYEGATDMLINRYSHELNKEKKEVPKEKMEEWEEKNWKRKACQNDNGKLILLDTYLLGSIRRGAFASGVQLSKKSGKSTISKGFIDSNLLIEESPVIEKCVVEPFSSNVKISKATIMSIRPKIKKGWKVTFEIYDLNEMFTVQELTKLLEYCGKFIGLGDWRPKFGRYSVLEVKEVKENV